MTPSQEHYNKFNEAEFCELCPEHAHAVHAMGTLLDLFVLRKRLRNILVNNDLVVNHERLVQLEETGEILSEEMLLRWAANDSEEDTAIIDLSKQD